MPIFRAILTPTPGCRPYPLISCGGNHAALVAIAEKQTLEANVGIAELVGVPLEIRCKAPPVYVSCHRADGHIERVAVGFCPQRPKIIQVQLCANVAGVAIGPSVMSKLGPCSWRL